MLLTITTTHRPATDLGHLLRKNPVRVQSFALNFGQAHVFYPEATEERCTAALLLEIDPIGLVRGRRGPAGEGRSLEQYVNDRPYVVSSFLSVAIAEVFGSALSGKCKDRRLPPGQSQAMELHPVHVAGPDGANDLPPGQPDRLSTDQVGGAAVIKRMSGKYVRRYPRSSVARDSA